MTDADFPALGELSPLRRRHMLLDGRRVQISDLLEADLLTPGTALRFDQTKNGPTFRVTVVDDGFLELEDGRIAQTPSGAARVATNGGSYDGWLVWRVEGDDRPLDALRRELLSRRAAQQRDEDPESSGGSRLVTATDPSNRFAWLESQRRLVDIDELPRLTVRSLLEMWGAASRSEDIVARVRADLANHGLTTDPDFREVGLDSMIALNLTASVADRGERGSTAPVAGDEDDSDQFDTGLKIGTLKSAMRGLAAVSHNGDIEEAVTKMMVNDYSQLAVLRGPRSLAGAVSWRSIAQARNLNPSATLADATVRAAVVPFDSNLTDSLAEIQANDFVFVSDSQARIVGIVTAADVVAAYGDVATPFLLLGELDRALRAVIRRAIAIKDVIALCDPDGARGISSFDDLSMGDYERVLENPAHWTTLRWNLHRPSFTTQLQRVRQVRNDVMHFNPDPLTEDSVRMIESLLAVVRTYGAERR